jgi:outer membrane protein assembly factor BamB
MKTINNILILFLLSLFLTSCNGLFDKDNTPTPTPLTKFTPEIKPQLLWSVRAGDTVDEYLKLNPASNTNAIFTTSINGTVTSINKINGNKNWQTNIGQSISAGPGADDHIVAVGTRHGAIFGINQANGQILWQNSVPGEILANPAVKHGIVIVKTINGLVQAFASDAGNKLWSFQQTEPALILYGASAPLIKDSNVIIGFANGNLAKFSLRAGQLDWIHPIAISEGVFTIQRMIDIDATPVIYGHRLYAATYQGKIASLDWYSGNILWKHDISSYTGMSADDNSLYISDAAGHIWSFNANTGNVNWRQEKLEARITTAPVTMGNYVVVGDAQGYLHWLDKNDGHFVARESARSGIYASPIVDNGILYVLTNKGYVMAYRIIG